MAHALAEILGDDNYDWKEAFGYAGEQDTSCYTEPLDIRRVITGNNIPITPFTRADVAEIYNLRVGENDGAEWMIWGQLKDGRYFYLKAGCDYTGWDCRASGQVYVGMDLEEFKRFGLDDDARREWHIDISGTGRKDEY